MRSFGILAVLCFAVCLVQGFPADGEGKKTKDGHSHHGHHGGMFMQCMGLNVTMTEDNKSKINTCFKPKDKSAQAESKEKLTEDQRKELFNKFRSCGLVCKAKALGLFDEAGKPIKDKVDAFNKVFFPEVAISAINTATSECIDKHSSGLVLKEGDCSSYNDLEDCIHKSIHKVCHPEKKTA